MPVLCWSSFSRHMPASLALAVRALTAAAAPPFSDIALARAASASAIKLSKLPACSRPLRQLLADEWQAALPAVQLLVFRCVLRVLRRPRCGDWPYNRPPHTPRQRTCRVQALERRLHGEGF